MPHDRRSRRVLLALLGLAGVALSVSVGCARSSNLRTSAGPLPELAPAGELHPDTGGATPGANPTTPAAGAGSWSRDAIAPTSRPVVDPGSNPGGSAASWSQGLPSKSKDVTATPASTANAPASAGGSPMPAGAEAANESAPGAGSAGAPGGEAPAPPVSPTPLLDAELRRARAVTRQHFESLNAIETPTPLADPVDPPASRPATAAVESKPADTEPYPEAPLPPLAASDRIPVDPGTLRPTANISLPTLMPIDPPAAGPVVGATVSPPPSLTADGRGPSPGQPATDVDAPEGRRPTGTLVKEEGDGAGVAADAAPVPAPASAPPDERPSSPGKPPAEADREHGPQLEIAALQLCSRVKDFGVVEAVDHQQVKVGRPMRVYCEMAGLEYQPRGEVFVSRLAAQIELRSGSDGPVVWEQAPGTAEYVCKRRRHDYYVSYRIELPRTLEPGRYRLRLVQTDLVGHRVASREIPITIVRSDTRVGGGS